MSRGLPNLANVLVAKGRNDIAKNILNKAIELNPKYLRPYSILAGLLVGEGNFKKAEFFKKEFRNKSKRY